MTIFHFLLHLITIVVYSHDNSQCSENLNNYILIWTKSFEISEYLDLRPIFSMPLLDGRFFYLFVVQSEWLREWLWEWLCPRVSVTSWHKPVSGSHIFSLLHTAWIQMGINYDKKELAQLKTPSATPLILWNSWRAQGMKTFKISLVYKQRLQIILIHNPACCCVLNTIIDDYQASFRHQFCSLLRWVDKINLLIRWLMHNTGGGGAIRENGKYLIKLLQNIGDWRVSRVESQCQV